MNVLYGLYPPSSGKILLDGREVQIGSPSEAISYGVGMVHQHFKLVDTLSVIENVILGIPTKKQKLDLEPAGTDCWNCARSMSSMWTRMKLYGVCQ